MSLLNFSVDDMYFVNGTHLIGHMKATYDDIVKVLGEPSFTQQCTEEKVNVEWVIRAEYINVFGEEDTTPITIYNWKDYDGGRECRSGDVYQWHIGGLKRDALELVQEIVGKEAL